MQYVNKKEKKKVESNTSYVMFSFTPAEEISHKKLNVCWAKITHAHKVRWNINKGQDFSQSNTAESQSGFDK